ncbi:hypothetical protein ATE77_06100 [Sphingopyxis sp. H005]|nr:hypothetical protein ATE76_01460 [Sphingopyxis sp. H093]KTE28568.1 hypothetical protein ATE75_11775 [Sphingopyxis sp. H080]KTE45307.1 hypothetical protein ATE77_06100 [Sphingopyxis sp. H005]KTE65787.1 hypothetical protein ATE74_15290 [Sphingopyxis sp. H085]
MASFVRGYSRQGFEGRNGRCSTGANSKVDDIPKLAFRESLDGQLHDDQGISAAQGAAGIFHFFRDLALTQFEIRKAFAFTLLGHDQFPSLGLPTVRFPMKGSPMMQTANDMVGVPPTSEEAPYRGAPRLPARGQSQRRVAAEGRTHAFGVCNAPYARVLRLGFPR